MKLSKNGLKKLTQWDTISPRKVQTLLYVLYFSRGGKKSLGVVYRNGRQKGNLCWNTDLKEELCNFLGLKHKQVVRYLFWLLACKWILVQDGQYKLSPGQFLLPKGNEKFIFIGVLGKGEKGYSILHYLEHEFNRQSHGKEKLKFKMSDRTRLNRKKKHLDIMSRKKKTPQVINKTLSFLSKEKSTTLREEKSPYQGWIRIKQPDNHLKKSETFFIHWEKIKELSEHQMVCFGLSSLCRAIFYKGKVYVYNKYLKLYEPLRGFKKQKRKPVGKKYEPEFFIPNYNPANQRKFTREELIAAKKARGF